MMCEASQPTATSHGTECSGNSSMCRQMLDVAERVIGRGHRQTTAANRELASLQGIGRTPDAQGTSIQDVCVDHRRADIRLAEQFLHRSDVVSVLEQMRRKGVPTIPQDK
jgi:hypothetical protein